MKLNKNSSVSDVAVAVGDALRKAGIRAVLTGGACAHLYASGALASFDADFVIEGGAETGLVDRALAPLGFVRRRDGQYVHKSLGFHVEFPAGPLAIGSDHEIRPILKRRQGAITLALSSTDSCRDRLAWYYDGDRQSLQTAVAIAMRNKVQLRKIKSWSDAQGKSDQYREFLRELRRTRAAKEKRSSSRSS